MNALFDEIQRLAPGYELDATQRPQVENHPDPEGYARVLERRMNDVREDAARYLETVAPDLGIAADDITNHDALAGVRYFRSGAIHGDDEGQLEAIGTLRLMRIAQRVALARVNLLDAIFLETHNRLPAPEGRAYYMSQRRQGRSWGAICAEIERNAG